MAAFTAARAREKALAAKISEGLVNTFVTALDREDIEALNSALYKIPKTIEKFAERYEIVSARLAGVDFGQRTLVLAAFQPKSLRNDRRTAPWPAHRSGEETAGSPADAGIGRRPHAAGALSHALSSKAMTRCARCWRRICSS